VGAIRVGFVKNEVRPYKKKEADHRSRGTKDTGEKGLSSVHHEGGAERDAKMPLCLPKIGGGSGEGDRT